MKNKLRHRFILLEYYIRYRQSFLYNWDIIISFFIGILISQIPSGQGPQLVCDILSQDGQPTFTSIAHNKAIVYDCKRSLA